MLEHEGADRNALAVPLEVVGVGVGGGRLGLQVLVLGQTAGGADFKKSEQFTVQKDIGPGIVEISLNAAGITMKDR